MFSLAIRHDNCVINEWIYLIIWPKSISNSSTVCYCRICSCRVLSGQQDGASWWLLIIFICFWLHLQWSDFADESLTLICVEWHFDVATSHRIHHIAHRPTAEYRRFTVFRLVHNIEWLWSSTMDYDRIKITLIRKLSTINLQTKKNTKKEILSSSWQHQPFTAVGTHKTATFRHLA